MLYVLNSFNIMYEDVDEDKNLQTSSILRIRDLLISKGFDPYLVIDASTRNRVDDEEGFEKFKENNVFKQAPAVREENKTDKYKSFM